MTMDARKPAVLMIAYTNYEIDPRVIRAAEAAAEAGFDVDFIALRRGSQPREELIRGVNVIRVPQERYRARSRAGYVLAYLEFFFRCMRLSTRLHFSKRYRVIHVNNMPDVLVFSVIIPRLLGARVILDIHDPMPETFGAKYGTGGGGAVYQAMLWLEKLSVAFATKTVTVNHPVRDHIVAAHGYRTGSVDVVANFADDRLFKPLAPSAIADRVRFVFHGTILARYGLKTLVEAVAAAKNKDRMQVRIIGEGDFSEALKALIRQHRVEPVIEFNNRVFPLQEIPSVLSDCHVGLVPLDVTPVSDKALPLKLIEYTCLGLPSITVNSTAIMFYLRPDECMFYEPGNVMQLASWLDRIAENPAMLDAYRAKLGDVQRRISWSNEKKRYVAMLRELAGTPDSSLATSAIAN